MSKIEDYINEATSRLKGDTEIQIEVQQELRSHIEASIDDTTEGESTDEAEDRALEEMGSAELIKEDLLETHASSMKWKGRLFFVAQAITIPILMVVMSWSLWSDSLIQFLSKDIVYDQAYPRMAGVEHPKVNIDEAIEKWRNEQTEVSFYEMYVYPEWNRENIHRLKKEIKLAQQISPNNGWLDQALVYCVVEYEMHDVNWRLYPEDEKQANYEKLWNNEKVQELLLVLKKAAEKPEYNPYRYSKVAQHQEHTQANLSTKTYMNYLVNGVRPLSYGDSMMLLRFAELLPYHISTLNFDENRAEIEFHIDTYLKLVDMVRKDNSLIGVLVSLAMMGALEDQIGESITSNLTEDAREKVAKIVALRKQRQERGDINQGLNKKMLDHLTGISNYYSATDLILESSYVVNIPDDRYIREELDYKKLLDETRRLTYISLDRHVIQLTALLISLGAIFFYFKIWFNKKKSVYPHLKLSFRDTKTLVLILLSIVVPLAVYSMLFIINEHGSRGWSLKFNTPYMVLEILILVFTIVALPLYIISEKVNKRCEQIGIDFQKSSKLSKITLILLTFCWAYLFLSKLNYLPYKSMWESWQNIVAATLGSALVSLFLYKICIGILSSLLKKEKDYTYKVTLSRAKIVYAILPLMVCLFVSNQLMKVRERKLINDLQHNESGEWLVLSKVESTVVKYYNERFDEIFSEE